MPQVDFELPYGNGFLKLGFNENQVCVEEVKPNKDLEAVIDPQKAVKMALASPIGVTNPFTGINGKTKVAITINDKTRPVPNSVLLPPLLEKLQACGAIRENITIFIASGTHKPMRASEFPLLVNENITQYCHMVAHDCDARDKLRALGETSRGTPVFVNRDFYAHNLKIVVGDIEPHHFAGYSGGVKSAAVGLAGRSTINANHKLLLDDRSFIGVFEHNPLRQDIEEIGAMMNIDLALNAVLNEKKEILGVFFGRPSAVITAGIRLVDQISRVSVKSHYDIVIASAGGYPKDINLYQAQKAMTHASLFCKPNGKIILVAECKEGIGSNAYLNFMRGVKKVDEVIEKFRQSEFMVGPHKAFQVARILQKYQVYLFSSLPPKIVRSLLLKPIEQIEMIVNLVNDKPGAKVAILPFATACIASLETESDNGRESFS